MPNSIGTSGSDSSNSASSSSNTTNKRTIDETVTLLRNDDDSCSLQDVIDCEKERSEIASAVLGASDHTNCSYDQGYVYRQALYSCLTCAKEMKSESDKSSDKSSDQSSEQKQHGICLACSYECHANHELVELYTKREFRCDCGSATKFPNRTCKLQPKKESQNESNKYNHNFSGRYCVCNKPYPAPEKEEKEQPESDQSEKKDQSATTDESEEEEEEMIQCTVCEDWFHLNHLPGHEQFPLSDEDYDEMVCHTCMKANSFLWSYQAQMATNKSKSTTTIKKPKEEEEEEEEVVNVEEKQEVKEDDSECFFLKKLRALNDKKEIAAENACCFVEDWRQALCKCPVCQAMYAKLSVEFLVRMNDTIRYYEDSGKSKETTNAIDGDKLLGDEMAKLDRFSQVELAHSFNDFRTELTDFLGSFAKNGKVVKAENVSDFFSKLNARKKQKTTETSKGGSSYF